MTDEATASTPEKKSMTLAEFWPRYALAHQAPGVNAAGMALESIQSGKYDRFVREGVIPRFGRPEGVARVVRLLLEPDN